MIALVVFHEKRSIPLGLLTSFRCSRPIDLRPAPHNDRVLGSRDPIASRQSIFLERNKIFVGNGPGPQMDGHYVGASGSVRRVFLLRPFGRFLVGGGRKTKVSALGRPSQNCETSYWPNGNGNFFGSRRLASFNCFSRNCWNPTNRLSVFSAEFNWICVMDFVSQMKSV